MTLKNNRAPLLCCFQLCAWFHCHIWIPTGVRVRKRLSWVLTSVTLTFDLWPWPFAWTSLLTMVISPENFMMIRWWEYGEKGVTDRQTDGRTDRRTDWTSHIDARSQLKIWLNVPNKSTRNDNTLKCKMQYYDGIFDIDDTVVKVTTSSDEHFVKMTVVYVYNLSKTKYNKNLVHIAWNVVLINCNSERVHTFI